MANKKDLATGLIGTALTSSATTLVLQTGYGAGMPATPFFLTLTPVGQLSTLGNSEIVSVTARSTDTLTIVRAQKGTTAKAFAVGDIVANGVYVDDILITSLANPYKFRVYRNAAYSAPAGANKVPFDTIVYDPNNNFNTGTALYTIPVTGLYSFSARMSVNGNVRTFFDFYINGVGQGRSNDTTATAPVGTFCTNELVLNAGDTVGVWLYTSGTANIEPDNNRAYFFGSYKGPA